MPIFFPPKVMFAKFYWFKSTASRKNGCQKENTSYQLLSQLGCLRLENSSKLLDQIRTSSNYSDMSEDEKPIGSIKFDMIKSIYLKKLELNPSGRLLLAKSVRSKEERDLKPCQHTTSSASTSLQFLILVEILLQLLLLVRVLKQSFRAEW
ncbi:hypothetical protein KEM48_010844 [Puccinia striiformis f. sp. tritici PST-130]|nr:hypothetical protein KEM48_010844 [Puccinia striiformis f. sp. tritici PST-130]